jgi:altronate dehydratase
MREYLSEKGIKVECLGWASVQMDGGITSVMDKAAGWFRETLEQDEKPAEQAVGLEYLRLGLTATGALNDAVARGFAQMARRIVTAGGLVVIPENAALLASQPFRETLLLAPDEVFPTLAYGQSAAENGLHVMETPTDHGVETLTGLGATGVEIMLSHQTGPLLQAHPMVPLLQVSADSDTCRRFSGDLDLILENSESQQSMSERLLELVLRVASRSYVPHLLAQGNTDFQLTRGLLVLSLYPFHPLVNSSLSIGLHPHNLVSRPVNGGEISPGRCA